MGLDGGYVLMVSGNHFKKLKGFDTKFYLYVEDCDLCMRSKYLGGQLIVLENFKVIHDAQRKSRKNWRFFILHIQSLLYYWKTILEPDKKCLIVSCVTPG